MNLLAPLAQGGFLTRVALGTFLQATAVILAAALISATLLRRRAAARYSLWLVALVWVILSPAMVVVAGRVSVPLRVVTLPDTQQQALSSDEPAPDQGAILPGPMWERNEDRIVRAGHRDQRRGFRLAVGNRDLAGAHLVRRRASSVRSGKGCRP